MIRAIARNSVGPAMLEPTPEKLRAALADRHNTLWVHLSNPTAEEASTILGGIFNFHPLAIEDCLGHVEHPKIDDYGTYLYVVMHGFHCETKTCDLHMQELDLFLGPNYVVTYEHEPLHATSLLWERVQRDDRFLQRGADGLAHAVIDILVDDLMPVLDQLDSVIDELEDDILANPRQETLERILAIKRSTLHLRRTVMPEREVVLRLSRDDTPLVQPKVRLYFRDVYDHLVRVVDINESLRDLVAGALEIYLSVVSNRLNEVMKVLTLVTTVFMPMSLVAGIYGMNFRFMPEIEWRYGYVFALSVMLVIAGTMVLWFRRRGWM